MVLTMYPFANQNYFGSLSGWRFNGSLVEIPPGGMFCGASLFPADDQVVLQIYSTVNGQVVVTQGNPSEGGVGDGDSDQCALSIFSAQPGQTVLGFGFTFFQWKVVLAPYCEGGYALNPQPSNASPSMNSLYVNSNAVIVPSNSTVAGIGLAQSAQNYNQVGIQIMTNEASGALGA